MRKETSRADGLSGSYAHALMMEQQSQMSPCVPGILSTTIMENVDIYKL